MATIIYVRKGPYERDGKFGKQYLVLATDGIYYEQEKPFENGIKEGSKLEVEGKPSANPKYFKLKSVKLLTPSSQVGENSKAGAAPIKTPPPAAQPTLSPKMQAEWIGLARQAMDMAFGNDWDPIVCAPIWAELIHHYYGEYVG